MELNSDLRLVLQQNTYLIGSLDASTIMIILVFLILIQQTVIAYYFFRFSLPYCLDRPISKLRWALDLYFTVKSVTSCIRLEPTQVLRLVPMGVHFCITETMRALCIKTFTLIKTLDWRNTFRLPIIENQFYLYVSLRLRLIFILFTDHQFVAHTYYNKRYGVTIVVFLEPSSYNNSKRIKKRQPKGYINI